MISQFVDRYNFDLATVKRSCVHFVQPDGRIIPFDTFSTLYRPGAPAAHTLPEDAAVLWASPVRSPVSSAPSLSRSEA